uniref:Uncharacterized protein n=1 Tax=Trepomonas sp. PC1 TaxID=1076344 RepID=A0A146K6I4_9EUKA|eukprot:JAP91129.1 hypothetical protein TPC1_17345 [Trepomonas sp. PC1]
MSKLKKNRQQSQEIERVLKIIDDGLKEFQVMWSDFSKNQSSKMEQQLRQQLQKLQKNRAQVRQWQDDPTLKDYAIRLTNSRQLIEAEMSRFKVSEKSIRNKDDSEAEQDEALAWINRCITNLKVEITNLEFTDTNKKQKRVKEQQATVYKNHLEKFERIHGAIEEQILTNDDLENARILIDEFIESIKIQYSEMDFDIYNEIDEIIDNGGKLEEQYEQEHDDKKQVNEEIIKQTNLILEQEQKQKDEKERAIREKKERDKREEEAKRQEELKRIEEEKRRVEEELQKQIEAEQKAAELKRQEEKRLQEKRLEEEKLIEMKQIEIQKQQIKFEQKSQPVQLKTPLKLQQAPNRWSLSSTNPQKAVLSNIDSNKVTAFSAIQIQKTQKVHEPKPISEDFLSLLDEPFTFQAEYNDQQQPQFVQTSLELAFRHRNPKIFEIFQQEKQNSQIELSDKQLQQRLTQAKQKLQIPEQKTIQIKVGQKCATYDSVKKVQIQQFESLSTDTLLYVFHHFPGTIEQELAAEILRRNWNYNQLKNCWVQNKNGKHVWYDFKSGQLFEGEVTGGVFEWL